MTLQARILEVIRVGLARPLPDDEFDTLAR